MSNVPKPLKGWRAIEWTRWLRGQVIVDPWPSPPLKPSGPELERRWWRPGKKRR